MSKIEPLSTVDAAWLRMEHPTNLMMVSGILTFDQPINFDHLKAVVEYRLLKFDRFRKRVVQPKVRLSPAYWEFDPTFDLKAHIHRVALPSPGDHKALQDMVSDLMSTPLDFSKPLWQIHVIENYGDGTAVFVRLHHCIADGMALVFVLLSLTDLSEDSPWPQADPADETQDNSGLSSTFEAMLKQANTALNAARQVTGKIVQESLESIVNPARALELALKGTDSALAAGRLVFRSPDPKTVFKGELGVAKRVAWSRHILLRDVKAIKNVTGGTVNDVLVSAMAGGLRRYMIHRGQSPDGVSFRAAVPVNLRTPEEMGTLGNKFGIVFLSLPVGVADPLDRLNEVHKRMEALKNSAEAPVALGILSGMGLAPMELQDSLVKMFGAKATAVMTNVPGPAMPLYFAGRKIKELMFWVPQSGRVGLGVSIISYAGKVLLGVATDVGLVPDPDKIIEGFYEEFEGLMELVRQAETAESAPAPIAQSAPQDDPDRCQGITKDGRRCKNRALDGSAYCRKHQPA